MDPATSIVLLEIVKILLKIIVFLIPTGIGFGVSWPIHNVIGQHNNIFLAISSIICINFYCFIVLVLVLKPTSKKIIIQESKPVKFQENFAITMNDLKQKEQNETY